MIFTKKLILTLLILASVQVFSQKKHINAQISDDNPYSDNLILSLDPAYFDYYSANLNAGWEAMIDLRIKKIFSINASFRESWRFGGYNLEEQSYARNKILDKKKNFEDLQGKNFEASTINDLNRYYWFETGISIHFIDKIYDIERNVYLRPATQKENEDEDIKVKAIVPSSQRVSYSVRGGYFKFTSALNNSNLGLVNGEDKLITGIERGTNNEKVFAENNAFTNMNCDGFYMGLGITKFQNFLINTEGFKTRKVHKYTNFYIDYMLSKNFNVDDFIFDSIIDFKNYNKIRRTYNPVSDKGYKIVHWGWRTGVSFKSPGLDSKFEIGARPGPETKRFYFMISFGFTLPYTIKILKPKEKELENPVKSEK
ncbi:MAG: hypothetical protein Q8880_04305 [Bacteroidota bacterium]|nr:hypothetical protein [Bacteroidota bacterium]